MVPYADTIIELKDGQIVKIQTNGNQTDEFQEISIEPPESGFLD